MAGPARRRPRADAGRPRPVLRRDREPAPDPQRAADPARRRAVRVHGRGPRARASTCSTTPTSTPDPTACSRDGFIFEMLIAHEHQHNETMLQLLQMVDGYEPVAQRRRRGARRAGHRTDRRWSRSREAATRIGAPEAASPTTTSAPATRSSSTPFAIDRAPVTNGAFAEFVAETGAEPPHVLGARRRGLGAHRLGQHASRSTRRSRSSTSSWHQADAFASWAGQAAADRGRVGGRGGRRRARAGQPRPLGFGCAPAGAYGDAAADCGAVQMLGDVWEWTADDFDGLPGLRGRSRTPSTREVFFGDRYKVLRGGSWATRRDVIRTSFRNWDLPGALADLLRPTLREGSRWLSRDETSGAPRDG